MTDEALMIEVKNDNVDSASLLFDRYSKRLYNFFVKISLDRDLGHDLMQSTFLRMIKYRKSFQEDKAFQTWIFQIARNVFADHLRKNKIMTSDRVDVYSINVPTSEDEDSVEIQKERVLHLAMAKLPEESKEILVLSRYQGLKYEQIAQIFDISVSSVKVKVHRAIKKLREYYVEIEKI